MSDRQIFKQARSEVLAGRDRQAVFATYQAQVKKPHHLAVTIASVPRPELKRRWQTANWVLVGLLILGAVGKALVLLQAFADRSTGMALAFTALGMVVPVAAAIETARFNGQIYGLLGALCTLAIVQVLLREHQDRVAAIADISFILVIFLLTQFIRAKVFPNLGLSGARRDAAGQFVF